MFDKVAVASLLSLGLACYGQTIDPKGIFVAPGNSGNNGTPARTAVKYGIQLNRNNETKPVAASNRFQSGDRFRFQFESNQNAYVYLLTRELQGDPDTMERYVGSKGIVVVHDGDDSNGAAPKYQLLWPTGGNSVRLTAHKPQMVPGQNWFQFDEKPGLEKLVLIVSPKPLDVERLFPGAGRAEAPAAHNDTNDDVLGQLRKDIEAMDKNSVVEDTSSKGICVGDCNNYVAPQNPANPYLVVIDLRHFRSTR